ncbi:MAG: purine-nucleoside phosphorylase [Mucinivorans sp.]
MYEKIKSITSLIQSKLGFSDSQPPQVALVLGSGLGALADCMVNCKYLQYSDIEGFPCSTVAGHVGRFVAGELGGRRVIAMQGRVHYYEGYTMNEVTLGVRVMCMMGVRTLIVTNAAGGVNPDFRVGDVMLIEDQINMLPNPLIGANIDQIGVRFPDMSEAYSLQLRELAVSQAKALSIPLQRGVYLASSGPSYETKAEYRYFSAIGADACGMSTTGEVIVARHAGVEVLGFSIITNVGITLNDGQLACANSHTDVVNAAQMAGGRLSQIIEKCIQKL